MIQVLEMPDTALQKTTQVLNVVLSNEYVLFAKTLNAHWNIQGPSYMELHIFFQTQYEALYLMIENVADRIRSLGNFATEPHNNFMRVMHLLEQSSDFGNQTQILQSLIHDHENIIQYIHAELPSISDAYNDHGATDFLIGVLLKHERMTWMLRTYLA